MRRCWTVATYQPFNARFWPCVGAMTFVSTMYMQLCCGDAGLHGDEPPTFEHY